MSSLAAPFRANALALPLGAASSLALHAVMAAGVIWAVTPTERPPQAVPEAELSVEAWEVPRSSASEARPEAEAARQEAASGENLAGSLVRKESAPAVSPGAEQAPPAAAQGDAVGSVRPAGEVLAAGTATPDPARAAPLPADAVPAAAPVAGSVRPAEPPAHSAPAQQPDAVAAAAADLRAENLVSAEARPVSAAAARPAPEAIAAAARPAQPVRAQPAAAVVAVPVVAPPAALAPARADAIRAGQAQIQPAAAVVSPPQTEALAPSAPATPALAAAAPAARPAPEAPAPRPAAAPEARPDRQDLASARIDGESTASAAPQAVPASLANPETPVTFGAAPPAQPAPAEAPPAERGKAILAPFGPDGRLDAKSLAAVAALTAPADPGSAAAGLQDGLTGLLSSIPCARVQMVFDPDTGDVVLRGNIPDASQAAALTSALVAQIGAGLPVRTDLRELPPPQCTVLAGLDALGLPQSTEQITNDRILGPGGFALEQIYHAGQPLNLTLQGADYPAYIYVDYFTADGQVLHLIPNSEVPLTRVAPDAPYDALRQQNGRGPLGLVFGPPYGRELAVAYASSEPLYDGLRPLQEPAGPYLEFLGERIAAARAADPGFKGEWVYFLITSQP